jgi:hypothetical protein
MARLKKVKQLFEILFGSIILPINTFQNFDIILELRILNIRLSQFKFISQNYSLLKFGIEFDSFYQLFYLSRRDHYFFLSI